MPIHAYYYIPDCAMMVDAEHDKEVNMETRPKGKLTLQVLGWTATPNLNLILRPSDVLEHPHYHSPLQQRLVMSNTDPIMPSSTDLQ
jgi:hypothetical protein